MYMSTPASMLRAIASLKPAATLWRVWRFLMSSQSETTSPEKPISPRSRSRSRKGEAWTGTPFTEPLLAMTVATPASRPARKEGRWTSRRLRAEIVASARSIPPDAWP
jgi:hypothetical protein